MTVKELINQLNSYSENTIVKIETRAFCLPSNIKEAKIFNSRPSIKFQKEGNGDVLISAEEAACEQVVLIIPKSGWDDLED